MPENMFLHSFQTTKGMPTSRQILGRRRRPSEIFGPSVSSFSRLDETEQDLYKPATFQDMDGTQVQLARFWCISHAFILFKIR